MGSILRASLVLLAIFTVLCGLIYPALVTGVARAAFPEQANGSLIQEGDKLLGSRLIGQPFDDPRYFWSRPSATAPYAYNGGASTGTNQGPLNPALKDAVTARVAALRAAEPAQTEEVPVDLVTASGSGLDPHISPAAAFHQVKRVAKVRNMHETDLETLVQQHIEGRDLGVLGEPRVNVLALNLALDGIKAAQ
jgi:potassium-transporting ATPase KdpC subunit